MHKPLAGVAAIAVLFAAGAAGAADIQTWKDPAADAVPLAVPPAAGADGAAGFGADATGGGRLIGDPAIEFADANHLAAGDGAVFAPLDQALHPPNARQWASIIEAPGSRPAEAKSAVRLALDWGAYVSALGPWALMAVGAAAIALVLRLTKKRYGVSLLDAFRRDPTL